MNTKETSVNSHLADSHSPQSLDLSPAARQIMIDDAEARFPNECCGFFFGKKEGDFRTVTEVQVVDNSKEGDQRRRFEISPRDYLKAEQYAAAYDLELLGIYHSHPSHPAIPSIHDHKVAWEGFSYLIVSVQEGKMDHIRSWTLDAENRFAEETVGVSREK